MRKWGRDINWQIIRPLLFVSFTGVLLLLGFQVFLSRVTNPKNTLGCPVSASSGLAESADTVAFFEDQSLVPLHNLTADLSDQDHKVLGASTGNKWIEIDLSDQQLIAHQDDRIFLKASISSGLWNKTPVGEYNIWYKIASTKMEGGSRLNKTYYYLPNVPYAMFFSGDYGIHGTYWHNNFGTPRSHGCINAPTAVAEKLFYWTDPQIPEGKRSVRATQDNSGTRVVIHE
jgi:hypothetical protein